MRSLANDLETAHRVFALLRPATVTVEVYIDPNTDRYVVLKLEEGRYFSDGRKGYRHAYRPIEIDKLREPTTLREAFLDALIRLREPWGEEPAPKPERVTVGWRVRNRSAEWYAYAPAHPDRAFAPKAWAGSIKPLLFRTCEQALQWIRERTQNPRASRVKGFYRIVRVTRRKRP